ncbi:hypothetical protein LguiB_022738 [Lonicera macranthoides]
MADEGEKSIQDELTIQIMLADQVVKLAQQAESSKLDCLELAKQATHLFQLLRSTAQLTASAHSLYEWPLRRIIGDVSINLQQALSLVQNCSHSSLLRQFFSISTSFEFHEVAKLLESSIADVKWLISIFSFSGTANLFLPSVANDNPILAYIWSYIAAVQMGQPLDRINGANNLALFATDDRNKKIIVEEGGIGPLLRLLKEGGSPEAQVAAVTALYNLATDQQRVKLMANKLAAPIIAQILGDSLMEVQVLLVNLVSRMAEMDSDVQEEFGRENVTRILLTLLSIDPLIDTNNEMWKNTSINISHSNFNDKRLKISCADALQKISKGSLANSQIISEPKALVCLAKLVEKERAELQINCLKVLMELSSVAESNADLRRTAFKPKSDSTKAVVDQLLRVTKEEKDPALLIPAIKSFGALARTFPARENQIIGPLVAQLGHSNADVSTEATIALGKFACPENFNCMEHSKAIIEFHGVPPLMNLILQKSSDRSRVNGLLLLCYLALHGGNIPALVQARALNVIDGAAEFAVFSHNPEFRALLAQATHQLTVYQAGATSYHRGSYAV